MSNFTIETTILVAVWETPVVFQGYFRMVEKTKDKEHFIFYRCENTQEGQTNLLSEEFSPDFYQFTHLYRDTEPFDILDRVSEDALYLLKYALYITAARMLTHHKQHLTYMDEIALSSITQTVHAILQQKIKLEEYEELGFAVAMDIHPTEHSVREAIHSLLAY